MTFGHAKKRLPLLCHKRTGRWDMASEFSRECLRLAMAFLLKMAIIWPSQGWPWLNEPITYIK